MSSDPLLFVVVLAIVFVAVVLAFGIGAFAKGGDFNKKYANKAMRWRLGAQFVAIILILIFVALR